MTNINLTDAAADIAATIPNRCPNFIATMHAAIDAYFDDPANPISLDDRMTLADLIIDLKI